MNWKELPKMRAPRSITFRDAGNARHKLFVGTLARLHYGQSRVDMTPRGTADGWGTVKNSWHYSLGAVNGGGDGWVGYGGLGGKNWLRYRLMRTGYLYAPTGDISEVGGSPTYNRDYLVSKPEMLYIGDEAFAVGCEYQWEGIWRLGSGNVNARWLVDGDRIKEEIIITNDARQWLKSGAPSGLSPSDTLLGFLFQVDWDIPRLSVGEVSVDKSTHFDATDSALSMRDAGGDLLGVMPVSYLRLYEPQDRPPRVPEIKLHKQFWQAEHGNFLFVGVPLSELEKMPDGALVFDPSIEEQVGTGTDDAEVDSDSDYQDTWGAIYIGNDSNVPDAQCGFRFQGVSIPQGATINSAYFKPTSNGNHSALIDTVLSAQDADDAATFSNYADFVGRDKTAESVAWDFGTGDDWTTGELLTSPDISSPIEAVVGRAGWSSGNDLVIFWDDDGSTYGHMRAVYSYNGSSENAAQFEADYTEAQDEVSPLTLTGVG